MSPQPLAGKVALVTGSSRGIGAAIVHRLAKDGAKVVVNYVNSAQDAQAVAESIDSTHGKGTAVAIKADVSSAAGSQGLVEDTLKVFGRVDILVLNAGYMDTKPLGQIDERQYDRHFDANVRGPLFLVKAASPHLQAGSRIVFFSTSVCRLSAVAPNYLLYAAAKGAVEQLSRVLSKEFAPKGITVNTVSPGPTDTELFRNGKTEEQINFFVNLNPSKRLGKPEDISGVVAFLAGPEGAWVNGQNILVNGAFVV